MKIIAFAALAALSSSAQATDQFDLVCTSKYHDATFHYRVDLTAERYCVTQDEGKRLTPIGSTCFQDTVLVGSNALSFGVDPVQYVDRATGEWSFKPIGDRYTMYVGTCEKTPFSGFPNVETKF